MSLNATLNATIALIEGRTETAKEILRSPNSDVTNVPEVIGRLHRAVKRAAAKEIRQALLQTLKLQADTPQSIEEEDAFYKGVNAVEAVLETHAESLEV